MCRNMAQLMNLGAPIRLFINNIQDNFDIAVAHVIYLAFPGVNAYLGIRAIFSSGLVS